jgi:deazaflavin-dependent oxidoreductase (nitroreductase family)
MNDPAADGLVQVHTPAMDQRPEGLRPALAPTRGVALIRRIAGPIWQLVGIAAVLEVADRRTGTPRRVPLIPVKVDGNWHLLSFGGVTEWARDLRAAGRGELRRKGRAQTFTAIEVDGDERDRVIAAYLSGSGPIKKDFARRPDAADHPVFRLEPLGGP